MKETATYLKQEKQRMDNMTAHREVYSIPFLSQEVQYGTVTPM